MGNGIEETAEGIGGIDALLRDRLLIMVRDQQAIDVLPHIPPRTDGLVLTGATAAARCREICNTMPDILPDTVVAMDYAGHTREFASADAPFGITTTLRLALTEPRRAG